VTNYHTDQSYQSTKSISSVLIWKRLLEPITRENGSVRAVTYKGNQVITRKYS